MNRLTQKPLFTFKALIRFVLLVFVFQYCPLKSQNEAKQWYFGNLAGLNFNTLPPTILTNGAMQANYSCASIADAAGNLLFYTNGSTIYDQTNAPMANGTGLFGNSGSGSSQGTIILKKPGSTNIYYVFTTQWISTANSGFYYSEVDMSLAGGNGSVTVKNATIAVNTTSISIGKLTATRHCNGSDIWLVAREWYYNPSVSTGTSVVNNNFRSYLITSTGLNTTPVLSTPTTYTFVNNIGWTWDYGCMKVSPNGKKLAVALYNFNNLSTTTNNNSFELYDFDNTTGVVSNSLALMSNTTSTTWNYAWGIEFSPDGSKLYGSKLNSGVNGGIFQWDMCAGSPTAIAASIYTVVGTTTVTNNFGAMQLAPNGKIYVARSGLQTLDVINNPNALGSACGYSGGGQSVSPKTSIYSLPNFPSFYFSQPPPATPFTYTASNLYGCQTASFNAFLSANPVFTNCGSTYSLSGVTWNFGDPASGTANTSTLTNPFHAYTTLGTYTAQLVLHYGCGIPNDTLKQPVIISQPCISVSSTSITCSHLGSATVTATGGLGPFSYTWQPSGQTNSVATGLSPGTYTLTVFDFGNNFTYTATTSFNSLIPLTGNLNASSSITCNGAATGTANYTGITGGSPNQNYLWTNGVNSYTAHAPNNLSAGLWSVTVTDALTGCVMNNVFYITQPTPMSLALSASSPSACVGSSIVLTGTNSGGTPGTGAGYTYSWTAGPQSFSTSVTKFTGGTYVYTLSSQDSYSCLTSNTIAVDFVNKPVLNLANTSICPLETGTLTVSGASSYTWSTGSLTNTTTDNPTLTTQYTVTGSALGCSSSSVASIILKGVPNPVFSSNSPVCNGLDLTLSAQGGTAYAWTGPLSFTSALQSNTLSAAAPANSGVYHLTLTASNSCTNSATFTLTVNPTPTVSATGATVCAGPSFNLSAASFPGASFFWKGPGSFVSIQQNPSQNGLVAASGNYTVKATSVPGCTNQAVATVTVTPPPQPLPYSNSPKCLGKNVVFSGSGSIGAASYAWSGPAGFSSSLADPTLSNASLAHNGAYTLVVTTGPCVRSATTPVIVYPLPTPTIVSNSPVCELSKLLLSATTPSANIFSYAWSGPAGFSSQAGSPARDSVAKTYAGNYSVLVTDANGCQASASAVVAVLDKPVLSASGATVCLNSSATLKVSGADFYDWYFKGVGFSNSASPIIASASNPVGSPALYIVNGKAVNGCTATASASVATLPLPVPSVAVQPSHHQCLGASFFFNAAGGVVFQWQGPGGMAAFGASLELRASNPAMAGVYSLTAFDANGCRGATSTFISLDPLPAASLSASKLSGCLPLCSDFVFTPALNSGSLASQSWVLDGKAYASRAELPRCFNKPGEVLLRVDFSDGNACANSVSLALEVYPLPVADFSFSPQRPVENLDVVSFSNASSGKGLNAFSWYFVNNSESKSLAENPSFVFSEAGSYPVALVVQNSMGCADSIVKVIHVDPDFGFFMPNAFTPNGDGTNEVFIPATRGVRLYNLQIFNRWGQLLFETKNPENGWDGSFNGKPCKEDVYSWKATVSPISGEQRVFTGEVVLIR